MFLKSSDTYCYVNVMLRKSKDLKVYDIPNIYDLLPVF